MCNHIDFWKGKTFVATIGEPWDFTSSAGDNKLTGTVRDSLTINGKTCLLCDVSPFYYSTNLITSVIVYNRYSKEQNITIKNATSKKGIIVHFEFSKNPTTISLAEFMNADKDSNNSFLIGTFYLVDK